tara:strand:+ start:711 stop:950 length:240 start_codon:yes stop_codon:yes gene_type:complete
MIHELNIFERYYKEIINNNKHFELRRDRGFNVGDTLILREIENDSIDKYTKRELTKTIKYISKGVPQYGLMDGFVILSI